MTNITIKLLLITTLVAFMVTAATASISSSYVFADDSKHFTHGGNGCAGGDGGFSSFAVSLAGHGGNGGGAHLDGTKQVVKCRDNSFNSVVTVGCSPINVPIDSTASTGADGTLTGGFGGHGGNSIAITESSDGGNDGHGGADSN